MSCNALVVDSAPFIKQCGNLSQLGKTLYTIPEVRHELKDAASIAFYDRHQVEVKAPSPQAIAAIVDFSKLTGDYPQLSTTDIKVMALAWQLQKEADPQSIRSVPIKPSATDGDKQKCPVTANSSSVEESKPTDGPGKCRNDWKDFDGGWITPKNVQRRKEQDINGILVQKEAKVAAIHVACMTTDFAMQVFFCYCSSLCNIMTSNIILIFYRMY